MAGIQDIDSGHSMDYSSIVSYIQTHSDTDSFEELDDVLWHYILSSLSAENLKRFIKDRPNSKYINEARLLLRWESIACRRDIFEINDFIKENHGFLLIREAYELLDDLKVEELKSMQVSTLPYPPNRLLNLIESNIFSIDELYHYGLMTEISYHKLLHFLESTRSIGYDFFRTCKINENLSNQDAIDVFLIGADYTDITNLLLGLSLTGSFSLDVDDILGHELRSFCDEGYLFPTLPLNHFLYRIHGKIYDSKNDVRHQVNFISAPLFYKGKLIESLNELDNNFIKNNHQKIIFFIVNQAQEIVRYSEEVITDNNKVDIVITKIRQIDILSSISNLLVPELMKKVKAIHFIVTNVKKENQKESNILNQYGYLLFKIKEMCWEYVINVPLIIPFSLGKSYVGGIFNYKSVDSEKICSIIKDSIPVKRHTMWQKIKSRFINIQKILK